jgi:hypothetical protein
MKFLGSAALGSSSARKYLRTWVSCFQKLRVSWVDKGSKFGLIEAVEDSVPGIPGES